MTRPLLAAFLLGLAPAAARAADPPHILFLLGDDWRWDTLGCAGSVVRTPHLDALARTGVRFTQCRVTTSICCVSRATLLTGQHMARHGIDRFGLPLAPEAWAAAYPARLRAAGYHTGFVGKFGVGKLAEKAFDFQRVYEGVHWMPDGKDGKVHVTAKNERDALAFLAARPKDKPFALSVSFFAAHAEDKAPEQYLPQPWSAKLYEGVTIPVPRTATDALYKRLPPFLATELNEGRVRWRKRFDTPERFQESMTNYYRLATEADVVVGRLVDELRRQGVLDNTLIVFTGDNGYFHAERGLADKWFPYEEALRVPLIVCDPRLPAARRGTTNDAMVLNLDVAPTLLAAAGVRVPPVMQGRDVAPLYLADRPPAWRDEFYYQHPVILGKDRIPRSEAVVRRDIKYTVWPDFDFEELYDLRTDPAEERNLAGERGKSATLAGRRVALAAWREAVK
ncbi:MAG TPA: sulfatase [Urbifossiella sp.]|jgi:arylsulfatase A-like enzyme|nr:sulfatase [Urbifossiella sp.]